MKKEKVGILTFQKTLNYGAILQLYALNNTLKRMGKEPVIINYQNEKIENTEFPKLKNSTKPKALLRMFAYYVWTINKRKVFNLFEREHFKTTKEYDKNNFRELEEEFEKIIVGSDQVWNTNLTNGDMNYFLKDLSKRVEKYSYAASFGVGEINQLQETDKMTSSLIEFKKIGVRELEGLKIVDTLVQREGVLNLDPTFLLTRSQWQQFSSEQKTEKPYLLLYFLKDKNKIEQGREYAKEKGLEVKYISMWPFVRRGIETIKDASPEEFISLVMNATAIITGSYHGFILALNFNVPVSVDFEKGRHNKNSRLDSIHLLFQIDNVKGDDCDNIDFFDDFSEVNEKLIPLREESIDFLKGI